MAIYGFLVSAPIGHVLTGALQKSFAGKTGTGAKIAQILANSLLISPIQTASKLIYFEFAILYQSKLHSVVFLASMAVINGAKSGGEIIKTIKAGFFSVLRVFFVMVEYYSRLADEII